MRVTHELGITEDRTPKNNLKRVEHRDPLGDMFHERGLSEPIRREDDGEMRGHDAEEQMVVLPPDGLNPVKVIVSDRGIIYDGKGHCNTLGLSARTHNTPLHARAFRTSRRLVKWQLP